MMNPKTGQRLNADLDALEFDVAHSCQLPPNEGMGHAFSFIYRRIMNGTTIPTVPIMLNTYYPPISRLPSAAMSSGKHCARP